MAKSKKRGGEKAHRKRVQARNNMIRGAQRKFQEQYQAELMRRLEELSKNSGDTKDDQSLLDEEQPLDIKI